MSSFLKIIYNNLSLKQKIFYTFAICAVIYVGFFLVSLLFTLIIFLVLGICFMALIKKIIKLFFPKRYQDIKNKSPNHHPKYAAHAAEDDMIEINPRK